MLREFPLDGLTLRAEAVGDPDGPVVLLLHGGGQTRHAWGGTAERLAAAGFHAIAVDGRGHGDSDWAPDADYRVETFARDLLAIADQIGAAPAVVGASLGGLTALLAEGELAPGTLGAVVLVDIAAQLDPDGAARIVAFMRAHPEGFADLEGAADAIAAYLPHRPPPSDLSGLAKNLRQHTNGRWYWHWDPDFLSGPNPPRESSDSERLHAAAARLTLPTLLVRGRLSDILSEEGARSFLDAAPHSEYVDVSDAGHMVAGDRNDAFGDATVEFLTRVLRPC